MTERDKLFQKFGPILLEAIVIMMVQETNRLRAQLNMQPVTKEMFFDEINNHLSEIQPYEWMEQEDN